MDLPPSLIIILLCLLFEGFFSGSEIAVVAADKIRLRNLARKGSGAAQLISSALERPERLLSATLIGTNISVVTSTTIATSIFVKKFGDSGVLYTTLIMTPLLLILGELIPKNLFQQRADSISLRIIRPLWLFYYLFYPLIYLLSRFTGSLSRVIGGSGEKIPFVTKEELKSILKIRGKGGDLKVSEKRMIHRIFSFSETTVEEVMIPLIEVVAIQEEAPVAEAVEKITQKGYSRLPVFRSRIDEIVGILNSFDLLGATQREKSIQPFIREALFVPETKAADELLFQLQREGKSMAIVVDEYGGAVGVVTIEDILEEIVGEIEDEHDDEAWLYRELGEGRYLFKARMEIDRINEKLPFKLPEGDYETLGGFIITHLGRIPREGEVIEYKNLTLTIKRATERSVLEVEIGVEHGGSE
ncbi:MAG: HlyC/CorC family transporter [Deltaproteobacteria bacterium]|nr:MAG: HlyC/CorC family transporter [Deltaproteobacteria bacterium]